MTARVDSATGLRLVASPAAPVYRIAKSSYGPMNPPVREGSKRRGWNRWDTPGRTVYMSDSAGTAYIEALAWAHEEAAARDRAIRKTAELFGVSANEARDMVEADTSGEYGIGIRLSDGGPGGIPATPAQVIAWSAKRIWTSVSWSTPPPPKPRPKPTNLFEGFHNWAKSEDGQNASLSLCTVALFAPTAGETVGAMFGGEVGAGIGAAAGDLVGMISGDASTAIDCSAELTSPSCILGLVGALVGPFGVEVRSAAKHVKLCPRSSARSV